MDTIQIQSNTPKHHPDTIHALIEVNRKKLHQQTLPSESLTSPDPPRCCLRMAESVCWRQLMSVDMCWLLLLSGYVLIMSGGQWGVWVYMNDVYGYLRCLHVSGGLSRCSSLEWWKIHTVLAESWKARFFNLVILRHQNIKMSTYILNKNGWVLPFFSFLVSVREKLKNTVTCRIAPHRDPNPDPDPSHL